MKLIEEKTLRKFMTNTEGIQYCNYNAKDEKLGRDYAIPHILIHETNIFLLFEDVKNELTDVVMPAMYFMRNITDEYKISPICIIVGDEDNEIIFMSNRAKRADNRLYYEIMTDMINESNDKITSEEKYALKKKVVEHQKDNIVAPEGAVLVKRGDSTIFAVEDIQKSQDVFENAYYCGFTGAFWFEQKGIKNKLMGVLSILTFGFYGISLIKGLAVYLGTVKDEETGFFYYPKRRGIIGKLWIVVYGIGTIIVAWKYFIPFQVWLIGMIERFIGFLINLF